ncbi:PepSY domain-containing protein [Dokdonia sp. PRO95]|uniref:PepSY-associated TM helix domain-containing protein n=1 Tax=Dokdonia sp. PRO95 TaxID=1239415 RepID=UPI00055524B7|nr:PepSY domain-containing protein [Dokdonia sp. PRO95]
MKNKKINQWLWKWHVIAGLIATPFIILFAITGGIYLFKEKYEKSHKERITVVSPSNYRYSYEEQRKTADAILGKPHNAMIIPTSDSLATEFVSGRFGHKRSIFINPYTNTQTGMIAASDGIMYKVRKLHGELLIGTPGTLAVELIASWMVVLLITGIFIWWPARGFKLHGFFIPRWKQGKQVLLRDLHAIIAFWISGLLLLVLAGAFPWTNIVGKNFKTLQEITDTGFPISWHGIGIGKPSSDKTIALDLMVEKAATLPIEGIITLDFPKGPAGVYSVGNTYYQDLQKQQKFHFNQYTGEQLLSQQWSDVGILMRGRMWVMAFHQGQFGQWNWYLMLCVALLLIISSTAAILSYFSKKPKGKWIVPKTPKTFNPSIIVIGLIILLGILFPLFGLSVLVIMIIEKIRATRI